MSETGSTKPTALQRGQMRRRLRHQQRIREALLLDLGALVFELHRQGRREPELLQAKAAEVSAVDKEVRAIAEALQADTALELLAPGVASLCSSCGALLSVEDHFCPNCGNPADPAIRGRDAPAEETGIDASGNGSGGHDLDEGAQEALGSAPPQRRPPPATAPNDEGKEDRDALGARMRRGLERMLDRRRHS